MDNSPPLIPSPPPFASSSSSSQPAPATSSDQEPWSTSNSSCPISRLAPLGEHHCSRCRDAFEAGELENQVCCLHQRSVSLPKNDGSKGKHVVWLRRERYSCPCCEREDRWFRSVCDLITHYYLDHLPPSASRLAIANQAARAATSGVAIDAADVSREDGLPVGVLGAGVAGGDGEEGSSSALSSIIVASGSTSAAPQPQPQSQQQAETSTSTERRSTRLKDSKPEPKPKPQPQPQLPPLPPPSPRSNSDGLSPPSIRRARAIVASFPKETQEELARISGGKIDLRTTLATEKQVVEERKREAREQQRQRMWRHHSLPLLSASSESGLLGFDFDGLDAELRESWGGRTTGSYAASDSLPSLSSVASSGRPGAGSTSSFEDAARPRTPSPPPPSRWTSPRKKQATSPNPNPASSSTQPPMSRSFGHPHLFPPPPSLLPVAGSSSRPPTRLGSDQPSSSKDRGRIIRKDVESTSKVAAAAVPASEGVLDGKKAGKKEEKPKRRR